MNNDMEKFSSQANPAVLNALKSIAKKEGRIFQSVIDEAFRDYIERKKSYAPRKHVLSALDESLKAYDSLYKKLAK